MKLLFVLIGTLAFAAVSRAEVVVSPAPDGEKLSDQYQVAAEGKDVPVYVARVLDPPFAGKEYDYGGAYAFANFDSSGPAKVRIRSPRTLTNLVVRPAVKGLHVHHESENTVVLTLPGPCKVSVEPDGKKGPLLLFANPLETNVPPKTNVIYYGPGVHQAGRIEVGSGQTLYLAGSAVVKGGVLAQGNDIRIAGRGILDSNDYEWRKGPTPHVLSIRGTNVHVSGITIRGASHWTIVPVDSLNVTIEDVKICGGRVQNDDGINPCNARDVRINRCFIRSDDDCVALKGLNLASSNNVERITVENTVLWCDRARIFLLGHESRAEYMREVVLRDLDIIHFTMTAFLFEPGEEMRMENVGVENVRVHGEGQGELVRLKPVVNQYMRNKVPGHIANIRFKNVAVQEGAAGGSSKGRYLIQVSGADSRHKVQNVVFDNLTINGERLAADSKHVQLGDHTENVRFLSADTIAK